MNLTERLFRSAACWATAAVVVVGLLVLVVRLRELQVVDSADYGFALARQSERRVLIAGPRGRILDRHGAELATSRRELSVVCRAERFQRRTWDATFAAITNGLSRVGRIIGRRSPLTANDVSRYVLQSRSYPLVAWSALSERELARFCEHESEFGGGFACVERETRVYPNGSLAAHAVGWVGASDAAAVAGDESFRHREKDLAGKSGLEQFYNDYLRGMPGEDRVVVDARQFAISTRRIVDPKRGLDLRTTLDAGIQRVAERMLEGRRGACVVLDPRTGDVLALASAPTYDLNLVRWERTYRALTVDPDKPLANRATGGYYAPGSTFKPVTALAGLQAGVDPESAHGCNGVFEYGAFRLRCTSVWGHGRMNMCDALMKSCNPYFCNLGMTVGTNLLVSTARAFGLGSRTGIDLHVDLPGVVPDAEWKARTYHERWYAADLIMMSIGQGMLAVSPLQMARVAGAIATGRLVTPRLKADLPVVSSPLPYPERQLDVLRRGMWLVVNGRDAVTGARTGSGWRGGEGVPVEVCGKTGTAEVGEGANRRNNTWFIAYAPKTNATVAVAMVVENGESGGGTTAPRVAEILAAAFRGEVRR